MASVNKNETEGLKFKGCQAEAIVWGPCWFRCSLKLFVVEEK